MAPSFSEYVPMPYTPAPDRDAFDIGFPGPDNPACEVILTRAQADLIARALSALLAGPPVAGLTDTQVGRNEVAAMADIVAETDPDCVNGWCL